MESVSLQKACICDIRRLEAALTRRMGFRRSLVRIQSPRHLRLVVTTGYGKPFLFIFSGPGTLWARIEPETAPKSGRLATTYSLIVHCPSETFSRCGLSVDSLPGGTPVCGEWRRRGIFPFKCLATKAFGSRHRRTPSGEWRAHLTGNVRSLWPQANFLEKVPPV